MSRTPSLTRAEAETACCTVYGNRWSPSAASAITADNRDHARRWLVACGVPSVIARGLSLSQLRAAWCDVSNATVERFVTSPMPSATTPEDTAPMLSVLDLRPGERKPAPITIDLDAQDDEPVAAPAPKLNGSMTPEQHIAAAVAAIMQQPRGVDETAVRNIVASEIAKVTLPRVLQVVINDEKRGELPALRHIAAEDLLTVVMLGIPAYIVGPAGASKTTTAEQIAQALGLKFYMQGAASGAHEYLGFVDAHGRYQTTPYRQAYEFGGLFLADECDASDPGALMPVNSGISNGVMAFPDQAEPVKRHPDFRLIAAANTYGNGADRIYVGRNQLDGATLDRFAFIDWAYDEKLEIAICGDADWCRYVQRVRAAVGKLALRHIISPRASIYGAKLLKAGMAQDKVRELVLWRGLTAADRARVQGAM